MSRKNKKLVLILSIICLLLVFIPLFTLRGADFGGSDDQGSETISEVTGSTYTPWAEPVLEKLLGGTVPAEMETLFFCVQTAIGTGILFFFLGRMYERKKLGRNNSDL